jgi:hypothetical protein
MLHAMLLFPIFALIVAPLVIGYAVFRLAAIPFGTNGRVGLLFAVLPIALVVWRALVRLHVWGADQACSEECWGNLGVGVTMISAAVGGVIACAVALGHAKPRPPRGL